MPKLVYKYPLVLDDYVEVRMPRGARLLDAQMQVSNTARANLVLWAVVDPDSAEVVRRFRIAGTGHPLTPAEVGAPHVATVQRHGFVWHIFDLGERG